MHFALGTCKFPDNVLFNRLTHRDFRKHFFQERGIQFGIVFLIRDNEEACHICTAGTHGKVVRTVREIMVRTVFVTGKQYCPVFAEPAVRDAEQLL